KSALSDLFGSRNRPDALFTANNASTIWVIEALQELKIEIGKDVALVGFDDVAFFTLLTPPVTAVRQPAAELGSMAARLLLQRINGEFKASSVRTVLPVTLTRRKPCASKKRNDPYLADPACLGGKRHTERQTASFKLLRFSASGTLAA